jgi:GT2 family glycosyltransferase
MRSVTAVVVTYQSARTIGETLATARRCYEEQLLDCVIVDYRSRDGTEELIQRAASWSRIVLTGKNNSHRYAEERCARLRAIPKHHGWLAATATELGEFVLWLCGPRWI